MEWNIMEAAGAYFLMDSPDQPGDDCEEILDEMLEALGNDDASCSVRRRMSLEKVIEKELVPLLKVSKDDLVFEKAVRLLATLTQPLDQLAPHTAAPLNDSVNSELRSLIAAAKSECTDVDFLKAFSAKMSDILKTDNLEPFNCQCLNHCVLLLRNLFHIRPGITLSDQANITHQCLISSFFMNELDKVIYTMLNHKNKQIWTIGMAQLISFLFKDYSGSLLEPDIDDTNSTSSTEDQQDIMELLAQAEQNTPPGSSEQNLSTNFKRRLRISTASENCSHSSEDDDFMLEFKSTEDGRLEIKVTNCSNHHAEDSSGSGEEMDVKDSVSKTLRGSHSSLNREPSSKETGLKVEAADNMEVVSSMNASSCLMDLDILVSYLKKFATDIMYSGFVDLVENIMRALLEKYDSILDHSFLMWTVGFFLSFALQQELDFNKFKEILNLDVFGFLVYEGVVCAEMIQLRHLHKHDCSVEKHRLHLVVCTLNQMFRTVMANKKLEYVQNIQRCLCNMGDLQNLFVLLIRGHLGGEQSVVYLRDSVQTNHLLMLMLEEWLAQGFIQEGGGVSQQFSMLAHVKKFATKHVMAKYGSLLEHQELLHKDTLNMAVLTMMYHVAGSCKRQDTLMQLPILNSFSEIWAKNAVCEQEEFQDLIEFVLEAFMSDAQKDPDQCVHNLFDSPHAMGSPQPGSLDSDAGVPELSDEEQMLVFTWMADLAGRDGAPDMVCRKLQQHGFSRTREEVSKYLQANGYVDTSSSPRTASPAPHPVPQEQPSPAHQSIASLQQELSTLSEDNLVEELLHRLREQGFESHLVWLQSQLLEGAYAKLAIQQPEYRLHLEEPVAKIFTIQNKAIPLVPWDEALEAAQADPLFSLLQQALGLTISDEANTLFPRIPVCLSPYALVAKAQQIGPIDALAVKFDINTLKEGMHQMDPVASKVQIQNVYNKPARYTDGQWLNMVMKANSKMSYSSS